jgi:hypothetical protein
MSPESPTLDVLSAVQARYRQGARERVNELCCPVDYDASLLKVLPPEILERDYGCGDPSRFVKKGDTVLDLGRAPERSASSRARSPGPRGA